MNRKYYNSAESWPTVEHYIRNIVEQCHVGDSHRTVILRFVLALAGGRDAWRLLFKARRKRILREIIRVHDENLSLYRRVMSGRI